ncbi:MAG TPA: hypothetical protein PK639_00975 [Candidatus Woesebacteria bacterium]|nr:hypothetical protein [Candidatus Woesebacteria bacterium]
MSEPRETNPITDFKANVILLGAKTALLKAQDVGISPQSLAELKRQADIIKSNERQGIEK